MQQKLPLGAPDGLQSCAEAGACCAQPEPPRTHMPPAPKQVVASSVDVEPHAAVMAAMTSSVKITPNERMGASR